jgi:hypothetical protein
MPRSTVKMVGLLEPTQKAVLDTLDAWPDARAAVVTVLAEANAAGGSKKDNDGPTISRAQLDALSISNPAKAAAEMARVRAGEVKFVY